jgi:DNA phosphorothioation-dependent restriction protein DptH
MHRLADWVITVDRNAGIEFFDSPRDVPGIYNAYVIDCVPERDDLGAMQMITSTTKTDEVRELLDRMLEEMSLSSSRRNCEFLVNQLKSLSGRLAMRLTSLGSRTTELIALALVHANCVAAVSNDPTWLSLKHGFFVPVDDVHDLAPKERQQPAEGDAASGAAVRSDLIYVSLPARGGLSFTFVEVKYRRHLRSSRDPQLIEQVAEQAETHRQQWLDWCFGPEVAEPLAAVRRSRLVRALRFYLEKARRHHLDEDRYQRLLAQLDKVMIDGSNYRLSEPEQPTRGYIFCPEMVRAEPELIGGTDTAIRLFGPSRLPDLTLGIEPPLLLATTIGQGTPSDASQNASMDFANDGAVALENARLDIGGSVVADVGELPNEEAVASRDLSDSTSAAAPDEHLVPILESTVDQLRPTKVQLGHERLTGEPVQWSVTSAANPHLMIVGLSGMGKTEVLLNICQQLLEQGVVPIVFSYHPDIDARLSRKLAHVRLLDHQQLGFNPMHIDQPAPHAHIDSAGNLRDIFSAMFPDLGDVQLERVRSAIRQSYTRLGWGGEAAEPPQTPEFRAFYHILQQETKPDRNLLARLTELDDYGVFQTTGAVCSLLESNIPTVIRIHGTQNEAVQRAVAMLALYNVYKEMFRRGVQPRITHAVVFDEAHRASRLRLLPRLAVECRKFGLSLILASQAARDFDTGLYSGIASYLLLRMTEQDANTLAKNITTSDQARRVADRLKQLDKYHALFFREGHRSPAHVSLLAPG